MAQQQKQNHTHKLKRHVYKTGAKTYYCVLDCTFRIACELALGKRCVCWRCGKDFALNSYSITLAKPHCEDCHIHKNDVKKKLRRKDDPVVENVIASVGAGVIGSLRERLNKIGSGIVSPASALGDSIHTHNPTNDSANDSSVTYKPFEEDEDLL